MQYLQTLLALLPFFDNNPQADHKIGFSPDIAASPSLLKPNHRTCTPGKLSFSPQFHNLSGIDFSNPNVEDILTGSHTPGQNPEGGSGDGFNPRRPQRGHGRQLRVHEKHHRHETNAQLEQSQQCPDPPVLSCSDEAESGSVDSCCVVTPGGALVHVQLWDLDIGQADS